VSEADTHLAELMQRLVEIQRDEKRSPKLMAEDEQLMRSLEKRNLAEKSRGSGLAQFSGA
jgi:signal transduction histidine kinase